jgi:excisionase family DNA binding protein
VPATLKRETIGKLEYSKVPLQTVWRWFRNGTLPAVKVGRYWRMRRDKLSAFIEAKEVTCPSSRQQRPRDGHDLFAEVTHDPPAVHK